MPTIFKYLGIITVAVGITLSVFYLMHKLIDGPVVTPEDTEPPMRVVFGPVEIPDDPIQPPPPPPPKPEEQEPPPDVPDIPHKKIARDEPIEKRFAFDPSDHGKGPTVYEGTLDTTDGGEGGPQRLVAIQPQYPRDAAMAGIEGWVKVRFTVTAAGTVTDIRILEANPNRVFNEAVLRTLARWKFEPAKNEGHPVASTVVQTLEFSLDDG